MIISAMMIRNKNQKNFLNIISFSKVSSDRPCPTLPKTIVVTEVKESNLQDCDQCADFSEFRAKYKELMATRRFLHSISS